MLRHLLPAILAAAVCAGEASSTPVIASLAIADGPALSKHWDASLYSKAWNDPALAWVRQQWDQVKAGWKAKPGFDFDTVLAKTSGLRCEFLGMTEGPNPAPRLRAQADFGAQARTMFTLLSETLTEPTQVAGADEARRRGEDGPVLARHGNRLVLGLNCPATPWPAGPAPADSHLVVDYLKLMQTISSQASAQDRASIDRMMHDLAPYWGVVTWDLNLVAQGLHESIVNDKAALGCIPVDRALLDRFPADALAAGAIGLDIAAIWKVVGPTWLGSLDTAMHHGQARGADVTRQELDTLLIGLGAAGGLEGLIHDLHGTCALAVTQGVPFPGMSIAVPRSAAVDALVGIGLAKLEVQPPVEGTSAILPIPNLPLMITVARDRSHWLLSSDAQFVPAWLSGKPNGFLGSAAGKAVLAKAPADAFVLGAMDTATMLRVATGFAAMGINQARDLPPEARQAILATLSRLARDSTPSWAWVAGTGTSRAEAEGALGMGVFPMAIIAAIAIPNLMESRITANEAATAATLKSGIFPAEIQFQAGGYMDQDADNVGEYGTLAELSGRMKTNRLEAGKIRLLMGPLAEGDTAHGYHYRIYLPDSTGGGISSDSAPRAVDANAADNQERYFAAYAWPESKDSGRRMFVLTNDGQLRSLPWDGKEPAWNAALGKGWEDQPTWPAYDGMRGRRQAPQPVDEHQEPATPPLF